MNEMGRLEDLIGKVLAVLSERGYRNTYVNHHKFIYAALRKYCVENSIDDYSEAIGQRFLEWITERKPHLRHHTMNEYRMTVRRLNCALTNTEWRPFVEREVPYTHSCYDELVNEYEKYLYKKGKTKQDVRGHMHIVARFLKFVELQGYPKLNMMKPQCVFDAFKASTSKCCFRNIIGAFLRYAYMYKLIDINLSLIVPGVRGHISVPTVYSPDEIEKLLSSIDRRTELGKRNYAIVLIAARLGLRACDIAAMKFDSLRLDSGTIEIVQVKTKQPLTLPLLEDVKSAIYDYIDNARPKSGDEHIFLNLRCYGAVSAQTVTANVQRMFDTSGIELGGRVHGSHALRSSLASALLAEGNNYPTIQKVLGHRDIQATRSYVKADIERLRANAIPVPKLAANYECLLADMRASV